MNISEPLTNLWPVKMDSSQMDQIIPVNARDAINRVGNLNIETENVVFDESFCAKDVDFVPVNFWFKYLLRYQNKDLREFM